MCAHWKVICKINCHCVWYLFKKNYLFLAMLGLHCCVQAFSSCGARDSHFGGFSCCGAWAPGCVDFRNCGSGALELTGLVALWHVGSSRTRNHTCVSCIGRQILYHWVLREVLCFHFREVILGFSWRQTHAAGLDAVILTGHSCHHPKVITSL